MKQFVCDAAKVLDCAQAAGPPGCPRTPEEIRDRLKIMANSFVVMSLSLSPHKDTRITGLTPQTFKPYIGAVGELEQDSGHWPKILELEREDLRNRSQKRKWVMGRSGLGNGVSCMYIYI